MKDAWLHRRAMKSGVIGPDVPLFLFSESARDAVQELYDGSTRNSETLNELQKHAVFPTPHFAYEILSRLPWFSVSKGRNVGEDQQLLLVVRAHVPEDAPADVECICFAKSDRAASGLQVVTAMFSHEGKGWRFPIEYEKAFAGDWAPIESVRKHYESFGVRLNFPMPHQKDEIDQLRPLIEGAAMLTSAWLLCATAVVSTPGLPREEGRSRAPEPKQRTRGAVAKPAEFAWSRISLDIDRTVSGGEKAQEAEARKLALHRVRAHLRFIKDKGLVPVRSHMRGNAAHGVRIGRTLVHKGGA